MRFLRQFWGGSSAYFRGKNGALLATVPQETIETVMTRVRWIQDGGKEILFIDLRQAPSPASLTALEAYIREMQSRPENSVLVLTDVTGCAYDSSVSARWKNEGLARARFIRGSAIFGI